MQGPICCGISILRNFWQNVPDFGTLSFFIIFQTTFCSLFSGQPPTSSYSYPAAVTVTSANMYAINPSSTTMAPNSTTVVSNHPSYLGKINIQQKFEW